MKLNVGDKAPDFSLLSSSGENVSLSSLKGNKVDLYIYPKDDTPGCTIEACEFRDNSTKIQANGASVYGISPDNAESHGSFIDKFDLNFELLSDEDKSVTIEYDVWGEKQLYGKTVIGMKRTTFLIDEQGIIQKIWKNVKPEGDAQQILNEIS